MKKIAILFGVLLGLCCSAMAQTRTLLMSDGSTMINCGETINFYDDGGPDGNYYPNQNLTHTITSPTGTLIRITFTAVKFYNNSSDYGYLHLHNGTSNTYTNITNNTSTWTFTSTSNVVTAKSFSRNSSRVAAGWKATITVIGCSSAVNLPCGSSPITIGGSNIEVDGGAYEADIFSEKTFTTALGSNLTLTFTDLPDDGTNDRIEVYDGADFSARRIATINESSATFLTTPIVSNGNALSFKFFSNASTNGSWAATLEPDPCFTQNSGVSLACGETLEIGGAYGASNFYATTYSCSDPNARMLINLSSLPNDGSNDYVEVYDGDLATGSRMGRFHGDETTVLYASSNTLTVLFRSNATNNGSWGASVSVVCPEVLTTPPDIACGASYVINETNAEYANLQYTRQVFRAANANARLVFDFTALPDDGDNDKVLVYDGEGASATLRGIYYRGETTPSAIYSSSNVMTVEFLSNEDVTGVWNATVSAICIDELAEQSLGCGGAYAINSTYTNLQYTSQVFRSTDPEAQILLDFAVVNGSGVLPHDNANDYVEVYDGEGASMTLIGRYYGFGRPRTVASTGPVMTVVFMSNSTQTGTWSAAVTVDCPDDINMPGPGGSHDPYVTCNATVYDDGGPSGNYSANLNNEYIVLRPGRPGTVLYLDGEYTFDWQHDYITIYDGEGTGGEVLWGGGLHGHGYPRARHRSTAHPCDDCDNCINATTPSDVQSADGHILKQRLLNSNPSITCVTYYPRVTSKTGSLTIRFHTDGDIECSGFSFHAYCIPKPDDCYHNGIVVARQTFDEYPVGVEMVVDDEHPYLRDGELPAEWAAACSYEFRGDGLTSNDGRYAIRAFACDNYQYFNYLDDHTHPGNIQRGYLFNIDAKKDQGDFYRGMIPLECPGVDKLLVSFWVANVNNSWYLPDDSIHFPKIKVAFYSDDTYTTVLAEDSTGWVPRMEMHGCMSDPNDWQYYSLELPNVETTNIWYKISNLGKDNNGNDFAIDDIEVRACLPPSILTRISGGQEIFSSANVCAGEELRLFASLDETLGAQSRYETPYYAWERGEEVTDPNDPNYPIRWTRMNFGAYDRWGEWALCEDCERLAFTNGEDISYDTEDYYENYNDITIVEVPSPTAPAYTHYYYRIIIAGSLDGLNSQYCRSISEPYEITVTRIPEIEFGGTNAICEGGTINLGVTSTSPTPGTWTIYSEKEGNVENTDPSTFHATLENTASGYQVHGAVHDTIIIQYTTSIENGGCWNRKKIPIYTLPDVTITPLTTTICEGSDITLHPSSNQVSSFQWDGGPSCSGNDWASDNTCADWLVSPITTTTYTLTVTTPHNILDEDGNDYVLNCVSDTNKVVTVLPKPTDLSVSGIPANPICPGTSVTLTPSATGTGTGTLYYRWDSNPYVEAGDDGFTLTIVPDATENHVLYVKEVRTVGGIEYDCDPAQLPVTINVYDPPALSIGTLTHLDCNGVNDGEIPASATSGTPFAGGYYEFGLDNEHFTHNTGSNLTEWTFTDLMGGEYMVYVRDQHCTDSASVTLIQPDAPLTASIHLPYIETCDEQSVGEATVLAEGGTPFGTAPDTYYTYYWDTDPAQTTATATGLGEHTYHVTVTDSKHCSATTEVAITARPVPAYTLGGNGLTKCLSDPATELSVNLSATNPIDVESYSWSTASGAHAGMPTPTSGTTLNAITVTPDAVGDYTYMVVVAAENGCSVTSNYTLSVSPIPTIALATGSGDKDQTKCNNEFRTGFVPIVFTFGGGATGVNFTWTSTPAPTCLSYDPGTMTISAVSNPPAVGTTYTYRIETTTAAGNACAQAAIEGSITIRNELTVSVTADHTACVSDDIGAATAEGVGGTPGTGTNPPYTYLWSNTETTETIDELHAGTYSVVVTDGAGCSASNSVVIEEKTNPTISIAKQDVLCKDGETGSITVTVTNPGTTASTSNPYTNGPTAQPNYYVFSKDGGTTTYNSSGAHYEQYPFTGLSTNGNETSYTYNIYVRDGNGCTVREDVEITQPTLLTATIYSYDTIATCQDQSVGAATVTPAGGTQGTTPAPAYTYAWNTVDDPHWTVDSTRQTIANLAANNYRVTVTDAHGCVATATVAIIPRPVPSINASTTADAVCLSSPTSTLSVLNNNTLPIASHSWSVTPTDGAGMPADNTTASLTVTPTASATAAVTYTYTDVVTAVNGCVVSGDVVLTVNPTAILDHTSGDLDQTLCFEKTLVPIVFEYSGGATNITLTWTDETPANTCLNYDIDDNTHTLTISEGSTPVAGTYAYTIATTGAISPCDNPTLSGTIIIRPELTVSVTGDHQSCVTGNIGVATAHPVGGKPFGTAPDTYYEYAWNNTETTATIDELEGGTYNVTVTDANTCTATASTTIVEKTNPAISISSSNVNCYGETTGSIEVTVTNHGTTTGTSNPYTNGPTAQPNYYVFSIDNGTTTVNSSGAHYEQHTFAVSTNGNESSYTYNIYVRDGNDCTASQDVEITQPSLLTATIYSYDTIATCQDQSVGAAQVTPAGGTQATAPAPSYTYAWNTVDAPHWTADSTRQTIANLAANNYRVTVTDAHGCVATATVAIIPRPVPSINASTTADAVCLSASTSTFSILNNNSLPIASHSWSVTPTDGAGMPADNTTASLTVTPTASATAAVTYTYTDVVTAENGCVVSGDVVLTVNPTAILDHTSGDLDQTLCFEKTLVPIVFEYSGGATGIDLTWTDGTPATTCLDFAIDNTAHTLTISEGSAPVAGTYAYTVATTGAISPCDNPILSGTIIIRPELTVTVSGDHQSCVTGAIGVATAHPVGGKPFGTAPDTYYEYAWNNTETTATIDELEGGTYSVTVTDANTCTATASTTIVEKPNPVVAISDVATLCPEIGTTSVEASITTATTADYTYTWTNDGLFAVTTTNPVTTSATSVTATVSVPDIETAGCSNTYTLKLQVEDANNCLSNLAEKVITVQDVTAPVLTTPGTWPDNITGQDHCFAQADTTGLLDANEIKALFSDCSNITVTVEDVATTTSNCGWTWLRTYTIKDACDNIYYVTGTTKPTMSVSGKDLTKPELTGLWPDNITNQNNCFANADISGLYSNEQVADLFTDCSSITVTSVDANTLTDDCGWTITRTYTIKDECNNTVSPAPTMSVSGKDQNPPTYTVPSQLTVYKTAACSFITDTTVTHSVPTALADDCSAAADLTLTFSDSEVSYGVCTDTIRRTWRLVDACGNVSVVDSVQTILITDTIKPTITRNVDSRPALGVGSCHYEIPDLTGYVTVSDNCTADADLVITQSPVAGTATNMNTDVTITVADKCGNTRSTTILVEYPSDIWVQATPPTICKGQETTLTVFAGAFSTSYYDYVWDNGIDPTMHTLDNTNTVTVTPESTTTYHVDITNDNNCTQGASITVIVKPLPVVTFPDLGNVCPNVGTQEIVANIEATTPGYTYTWSSNLTLDGTETGTQDGTQFTIGAVVPNDYNNNPDNCDRTNWITLHVTDNDALQCEYEATYTIVIKDEEAPHLITAGSFPTGEENMNLCYADRPAATPAADIKALYTDNCSDFNVSITTTESGDNCAWTVRYTYVITDLCDNTVTPAPYIEYTGGDTENPTITCPRNYSLPADDDHNYATITIPVPTTADNCEVASVVNDFNGTDDASDHYPLGTTTVTYTVTDGCNHSVDCSFTVVVRDSTPPCIGCDHEDPIDPYDPDDPDGITCESIVATMGGASGTFNISTSNHEDHYHHGDNSWNITYNDNTTDYGEITAVCNLTGATTATGLTTLNGQDFAIGTTTVTWIVTDTSNNSSSCSFIVVVSDDEDPCIGCDSTDITDPFNPDNPNGISCESIVASFQGSVEIGTTEHLNYYLHNDNSWNITVNDNVGIDSVTYTVSGATTVINAPNTTLNGQHFEIGTTRVTWTVVDVSGHSVSCEFDVIITDDEDPCIGCDPDDTDDPFNPDDPQGISCADIVAAMGGTAGRLEVATSNNLDYYLHNDNTWNITASDNVGIRSIVYNVDGATTAVNAPNTTLNGQHFEIGETTVTWTVTDVSGRTSTCEFTVVVSDEQPPCIGCDPDDPFDPFNPNDPQGVSCASIVEAMGGTASTVTVGTSNHLDYYLHGDNSWNITANDNVGVASIVYSLSGSTTTITAPNTSLNGQRFEIGTTVVTWTVTDVTGIESTCEFTVVVTDDEDPCIGCDPTDPDNPFNPTDPDGISCGSIINAMGGTGSSFDVSTTNNLDYYHHDNDDWDITANDNVGVFSIVYTVSGATTTVNAPNTTLNGQDFEIGSTTVTWTVTDVSGRTSTCQFTVIVSDEEPPCIGCDPTDPVDPFDPNDPQGVSCASIVAAMGGSASTVSVGTSDHLDYYLHGDDTWNITASDNVGVASIVYSVSGSTTTVTAPNTTLNGQRFEIGTTLVTWTVTDVSGLTSTCEFTVVVTDDEDPCIGCDPDDPDDPFNPDDPQGISCADIVAAMGGTAGRLEVATTTNLDYYLHNDNTWNITASDNVGIRSIVYSVDGATTAVNAPNTTLNGQHFEIGETTVTWTVTDVSGRTSTCEFTVVVSDEQPPCIGCDPDDPFDPFNPNDPQGVSCASIVEAMGGTASTVSVSTSNHLDYYLHNDNSWNITASDNVGVASIVYGLSGSTTAITAPNTTLNGQRFEIGTTLVTWTVTDVTGLESTCEFTVVVTDDEDPCIGCDPTDPTDPFNPVDPDGISCGSIINSMGGTGSTFDVQTTTNLDYYHHDNDDWDITANDNVGIFSIVYSVDGATTTVNAPNTTLNGQNFEIGETTVTWTVTDVSGRTSTCSFTVVVSDDEPPCIGCDPTDPVDPFDPNDPQGVSCASIVAAMGGSASTVSVGTSDHLDYYLHNDNSWNITASDNVGVASIVYSVDGATTTVNAPNTTLNGQRFEIGTTLVTWTVTDVSGLTSTCEFTVVVTDDEDPCIGCDPDDPVDPFNPDDPQGVSCADIVAAMGGTAGRLEVATSNNLDYYLHDNDSWNITASDNVGILTIVYSVDGATTAVNAPNTTLNGQHFEIGETTVTWTVTDVSGRTSTCEFTVVVSDEEPPCIGCDPTDPIDPFNPDDPQGVSCESIVAAMGGTASTVSVGTSNHLDYYLHDDDSWDITANDNVGVVSIVYSLSGSTTAITAPNTTLNGQRFEIGTTIVTWTVTDATGLESTCEFTVVVTDDEEPCIGCDPTDPDDPFNPNDPDGVSCLSITNNTGNVNVNTSLGQTYYLHEDDSWNITANDNSAIHSITYSVSGATTTVDGSNRTLNGQRFNIGTTVVTWTVVDYYGLTSTCDFTVTVTDIEPPTISCPDAIGNIACIDDVPPAYATYAQFAAAGGSAYDVNGINESSFALLSQTSDGNTCPEVLTRTYQIADIAGNTQTCTQEITVRDTIAPLITGAQPTLNVGQGQNCEFPLPDFTSVVRAMSEDNCTSNGDLVIQQVPQATTTIITSNTDVTIFVSDACGNTSRIIGHAVVPQPLEHTVSFSEILCAGQTSVVTIGAQGGTAPYNGIGQIVEPAGTHNYTVSDANGCTSDFEVVIPQPQLLQTEIPDTGVLNVACYGLNTGYASVSVIGGTPDYTFVWSTTPVQTTQRAVNLTAGGYSVTVTDTKGCTSTSAITITQPIAELMTSFVNTDVTDVACYGEATGSANVTVTGGTTPYEYSWNTSPEQTTANATNLTAGDYTVTVTDANGCTSFASVNIAGQSELLVASFAEGSTTDVACYGQSTGSASVTVEGGTPGYTYRWNSYPVQTTQTATNLPTGEYVVVVTDTHGCTSTASTTISGQSYPLVASFADGSIEDVLCFGEATGSASVTASGGTPDYTYSWNISPQQTTSTVTNLPAGQYIVTVTDSHGCTATSVARINGQSSPISASFMAGSVTNIPCYGMITGSATVTVNGGTPEYLYAWNSEPMQTTPTAQNLPAGNYEVTVTDAHGCTTTASTTITQPALLEASATSGDATCGSTGGSVTAIVIGGAGQYEYLWTNSAGQNYTGPRVTNIAPSTYNLVVTDYNGCTATAVTSVRAVGSISARIEIEALPGCGNNESAGRLQAVAESGISPFTYSWNNGSTNVVASNLSAGSYSVTLTDSWGCTAYAATNIESNDDLEISVSATSISCFGDSNATVTVVALRGQQPYTYAWNNGANSSILQNVAAGRYSITVIDANMCAKAETIEVTQPDRLVLESNVKTISCHGKADGSIALNAIGGTEPYSFSIIMDDNFHSGNYLSGLPVGTYSLEVSDANGCLANNTIQLVEPEEFTSSYNVGMPSCSGNNDGYVEISAMGGTKPYMYGWDSYYSDVPLLTGLRQGQYTISVVDANKCTYQVASISLTDMAGDCIKIPNVFTPNGDGVNDTWIIENIEMFPDATVYVFNRWGQMLYKGTGNDEPWDGSYRGHYVPAGTYLYIVDLYQKTEAYKGTVTVIY